MTPLPTWAQSEAGRRGGRSRRAGRLQNEKPYGIAVIAIAEYPDPGVLRQV